jgi:FdhD protein
MTTGRISSDITLKAARAGIPIIISHSAPTDLALKIAKDANMTMIGFVRGSRMNVYCGENRILR